MLYISQFTKHNNPNFNTKSLLLSIIKQSI